MNEMVERGQSALKAYWLEHGYDPSDPDDGPVRSIILSMREATNAMCRAADGMQASSLVIGECGFIDGHDASKIWQVMIDEALK